MIKKLIVFMFFNISLFANILETADISGITFKDLVNEEIITYNPKTNELNKYYYFLKNGQLYKNKDVITIYPSNTIPTSERIINYKRELESIGCMSYKVKECIKSYISKKVYFNNVGQKSYILPKEKRKVFDIIKYYSK